MIINKLAEILLNPNRLRTKAQAKINKNSSKLMQIVQTGMLLFHKAQ
jgi:hypothetical protein